MKEYVLMDGDWLQVVEMGRTTVVVLTAHFLLLTVPKTAAIEGWKVA